MTPMIPTLITTVLTVAAFCAYVTRVQLALNAPLPDPSADWWPQFERQFRSHVRQLARNARHGYHPRHGHHPRHGYHRPHR